MSFDRAKDSFDQSAQDLDKVINVARALSKRDQVVLLGHSFGPLIQNDYLSKYFEKQNVSASINLAPGTVSLESRIHCIVKRKQEIKKMRNILNKEKNPTLRESLSSMIAVTQFYDLDKAKEFIQKCLESDSLLLLNNKTSIFESSKNISCENNWNLDDDLIKKIRKDTSYEQNLKKITPPTLIIHGESDSIPLTNSQKLQTLIPNSELHVIAKTAHSMFYEKPAETDALISDFLNRVDAGKKIATGKFDGKSDVKSEIKQRQNNRIIQDASVV